MASSNFSYSGHTGALYAAAYVTEVTTSGTSRRVRVRIVVCSNDGFSDRRDASYSVSCTQSGTNESVGYYQGFWITGTEQTIFDETFSVTVSGASAAVNLSFSVSMLSASAGTRTISGGITTLYLTAEPEAGPSQVTLSTDTVQMGQKLLISISRDNPGCIHQLHCYFSEQEHMEIALDVAASHTWTVPDLAHRCSNALALPCIIACITYYNGKFIGYTTASLTLTVPDPTTPSLEGGEITLGQDCTILCPRNSQSFTQKLTLEFYGLTLNIGEGKLDSVRWTPGYDPAKQIPNLTYGTGTLKCTTFNGTAEVGTGTVTVRVVVPENDVTRPRFTGEGLTLTPVSSLPEAFSGVYLRGKTGLLAHISAQSDYSSLADYAVTVGSQSAQGNPAAIDLLVSEGDVRVTAKVTDARGFSAAITTTIQILPYRNPRVTPCTGYSTVICERSEENGQLSTRGTYLAIKAGKSFSSVVIHGVEQNRCRLRYRWKLSSQQAYGEWIGLLPEDSGETEISLLVGNVVSDLQRSYLVQIEAADTLGGSHVLTFQIMTEAVSFVLYDGEDGAGFGKYPEEPHVVDIASHMTLRVRGNLVVDGTAWQDLGLAEAVAESAVSCGHKQETGCHYQISNGNHVYLAFDCGFDYGGTAVVINRTPIPEGSRPRRQVYALCPANDRGIALVSADTDGYIRIQWVQHLTDTAPVIWLDGYLDYWI